MTKKKEPEVVRLKLSHNFVTVPLTYGVNSTRNVDKAKEVMDDEVRERLSKFRIKLR
jgi:hypothetical protein